MRTFAIVATVLAIGCAGARLPAPAELDTRTERCRSCQMMVSDPRTAAQIVAPGEEPVFFDDLGCLAKWLTRGPLARDAIVYVADHRTRAWIVAEHAVFTRAPGAQTPMGSHLIAHASASSLEQDPAGKQGEAVSPQEILGDRVRDTRRPS